MAYDIAYEGDNHDGLALFLGRLAHATNPWAVEVTRSETPDGDPTEHTADYALLEVDGGRVRLRPWPDDTEVPEDAGQDLWVDADRISKVRVY